MHVIKGLLNRRQFLALGFHFLLPEGVPLLCAGSCCYFFVHKEHLQIGFSLSVDFDPDNYEGLVLESLPPSLACPFLLMPSAVTG